MAKLFGKLFKNKEAEKWKKKAEELRVAYKRVSMEERSWSDAIGQAFIHGIMSHEAYEFISNYHRATLEEIYKVDFAKGAKS